MAELDLYISLQKRYGYGRMAIFENSSGKFVGIGGIDNVTLDSKEIQLGFSLHKEFWGKGYASEFSREILSIFDRSARITAYSSVENLLAHKVLLNLGFVHSGQKIYERSGVEREYFVLSRLTAFISVKDDDKNDKILDIARILSNTGYNIVATSGTQGFLLQNGIHCKRVNKVSDGQDNIVKAISGGKIHFVINTTSGLKSLRDSLSIRRAIISQKILYATTIEGAMAVVQSISKIDLL
jgi:hypothetical protein